MSEIEIVSALTQLDFWPISKELNKEEIHSKWKLLIRYYHPDTNNSVAFKDGEKAQKVNQAHDFLIDNLEIVNKYIRKINNIQTEEEKRTQQEELRRQQEAKKQEELRRQQENQRKAQDEELERYVQEIIKKNEQKRTRNKIKSDESAFNFIFKFLIMLLALASAVISFISPNGNQDVEGTPLFVYNFMFVLPIVILTIIPSTRRKVFTYFVCPFLLFAAIIMMIGTLGLS